MIHCIDYDLRKPVFTSDNETLINEFVNKNNLQNALALIGDEDDLFINLSFTELNDLNKNLGGVEKYTNATEAAEGIFSLLEESKKTPVFTKIIGEKYLKSDPSGLADEPAKSKPTKIGKPKAKPVEGGKAKSIRLIDIIDKQLTVGDETPVKKIHISMVELLEFDGPMVYADLIENLSLELGKSENLLRGYVTDGIRKNYIKVEEEDEL